MGGCFGLLDDYGNPYRYPADRLVECWPRLDIFWLNRIGALLAGTVTELEWETGGGPACASRTDIEIAGTKIPLTWDTPMPGVERPWWSCPLCSARCRFVFLRGGTIACRRCLRLDYAVRHLRRQTPAVGRVERLRRRLADCEPRPSRLSPHASGAAAAARITTSWSNRSSTRSPRSSAICRASRMTLSGGSAFARNDESGSVLPHG
jgi:hypothetical protein